MERFIGTDTGSVELFLQHIHLRNCDNLSYRGTYFYNLCRRCLPPGIGTTVTLISACLSENAEAGRTGISWGVRKYGYHWARGPAYRVDNDKHLPVELLQKSR